MEYAKFLNLDWISLEVCWISIVLIVLSDENRSPVARAFVILTLWV